jgi:autotransporter family porin
VFGTDTGIKAQNFGGSLTINAQSVGADGYGINAYNRGAGALAITTTGPVSANPGGKDGIYAVNSGTSLTISAGGAVSGARNGVYAINDGFGDTSITTSASVSGGSNIGILAKNNNSVGTLTINAQDVSGGTTGIYASSVSTAPVSITSTGTVRGASGYGIQAKVYGPTQVTVQANNVYGGADGIQVVSDNAALSITTTGVVTGTNGTGIFARTTYGDSVTVQSTGPVTGAGDGIFAQLGGSEQDSEPHGTLSIAVAGPVTGGTAPASTPGITATTARPPPSRSLRPAS